MPLIADVHRAKANAGRFRFPSDRPEADAVLSSIDDCGASMGIHPEFSPSDRQSGNLDDARRTMWLWAEPIIIDRAVEVYGRILDEAGTVALARKHCRLWRNVLLDRAFAVAPIMDELRRTEADLGLREALVDDVNDVILEELVDIVMSRYRASRNMIKTFSLVLMSATSCLGTVRAAA